MKVNITGKNNERIGLYSTDNNGIKHWIEMEFDGTIKYHEQDGYPDDPDKRTEAGNEHVNQARRFARYWVYRKRGYNTLESTNNPDRIALAAVALQLLSVDTVERLFGELYHQFCTESTADERPVVLPDGVSHREAVYQQDIYLDFDNPPGAYEELLCNDATLEQLAAVDESTDELSNRDVAMTLEATTVETDTLSAVEDGALIEAVSGVHIHWDDVLGQYHTQHGDQPALERDPDARVEIFAFEPDSVAELREQLVRNLLCQVRDCYLTMGIAPPEPVRILGHGRHDASTWYNHYDFYAEYFDPDAEVDTWYEEHTPENAYEHSIETQPINSA